MLAKRIIPCLDVKDSRVVKGVRFTNLLDAGDPVAQAAHYDREGADEIVFLDITASSERREILLDTVRRTAEVAFTPLTVGGGIRTVEDARKLLECGADKITLNTAAISDPGLITSCADRFGSQAVVVAVDAKRRGDGWTVYAYGGRRQTALDTLAWAKRVQSLGAGEILLTSMDRDGTQNGYDVSLTRAVSTSVSIPVIASGGCGNPRHIGDILTRGRADAALAASIFHYREHSILETKAYLHRRGINVRMESSIVEGGRE